MIDRDSLKYTDDVIATLQSGNAIWYIANALNIPAKDVEYHYNEVVGLAHKGTVLPLSGAVSFQLDDDTPKKRGLARRQYTKTYMFPRNAAYYAERSGEQVAKELGVTVRVVRGFIGRYGYRLNRKFPRSKATKVAWPKDRAWYETRSAYEAAQELRVRPDTVRRYALRHGFQISKKKRKVNWPSDPAWYAKRTASEICTELCIEISRVSDYCERRGYVLLPYVRSKGAPWPSDPAWYEARTRRQIAKELGRNYASVNAHVYRNKLKKRRGE